MTQPIEERESWFQRNKPWLFVLVPLCLFAAFMLMPDAVWERIKPNRWGLKGARLLTAQEPKILLAHLHSRSHGRGSSFNKLVTVDLDSGAELGQTVTSDWVEFLGLTERHLWVRKGGVRSKRWIAYALPGLGQAIDLEELIGDRNEVDWPVDQVRLDRHGGEKLFIKSQTGDWFELTCGDGRLVASHDPGMDPRHLVAMGAPRCDPIPGPPRAIDGELLLDGAVLCDNATGRPLDLGGGDRLVAFQDLRRETGKLILGRLAGGVAWVWRFHERERFGQRPAEAHGYRVAFASVQGPGLALVLEQEDGEGDLWVVGLDPADGRQRWARRYD